MDARPNRLDQPPTEPIDVAVYADVAPTLEDAADALDTTDADVPILSEPSRRFPIVLHHDPHAGRTIESFFSGFDAPGQPGAATLIGARNPVRTGAAAAESSARSHAVPAPREDAALPADLLIDPSTGLDGPAGWDHAVTLEAARLQRYRRPTTIVIGELDGLHRLTETFGPGAAERLVPAIADAFRREARGADRVARLGWARFAVLLPETDEIQAINYVERVRAACDRWLEAGAVSLRLSLGWAAPPATGELEAGFRLAEQRMYAERRGSRPSRRPTEPPLNRPAGM